MGYRYQDALDAGLTDQDIAEHLARKTKYNLKGALDAGLPLSDIVQHLLKKDASKKKPVIAPDEVVDPLETKGITPETERPGFFSEAAKGVGTFAARVPETINAGLQYVGNRMKDGVLEKAIPIGGGKHVSDIGAEWARMGKEGAEYWKEKQRPFEQDDRYKGKNVWDDPWMLKEPEWWSYNVSQMAGDLGLSIVPAIGAGKMAMQIGSQTLKLAPHVAKNIAALGAALTGGAIGSGMEATSTYQEVLKETGDEKQAARAAEMMFGSVIALNTFSSAKILEVAGKGLMAKLSKIGIASLAEGVSEGAEEPAEVAAKIAAKMIEGKPLPKNIPEMFIDSLKSALTVMGPAALTGGGMSAATTIFEGQDGGATRDQKQPLNDRPIQPEQIRQGLSSGNLTPEQAHDLKDLYPELRPVINDILAGHVKNQVEIKLKNGPIELTDVVKSFPVPYKSKPTPVKPISVPPRQPDWNMGSGQPQLQEFNEPAMVQQNRVQRFLPPPEPLLIGPPPTDRGPQKPNQWGPVRGEGFTMTQTRDTGNDKSSQWLVEIQDADLKNGLEYQLGNLLSAQGPGKAYLEDGEVIGWKSGNPEWFQDQGITKEKAAAAIQKAIDGKPLGMAEARIVEGALNEVNDQLFDDFYRSLKNDASIDNGEIEQAKSDGEREADAELERDYQEAERLALQGDFDEESQAELENFFASIGRQPVAVSDQEGVPFGDEPGQPQNKPVEPVSATPVGEEAEGVQPSAPIAEEQASGVEGKVGKEPWEGLKPKLLELKNKLEEESNRLNENDSSIPRAEDDPDLSKLNDFIELGDLVFKKHGVLKGNAQKALVDIYEEVYPKILSKYPELAAQSGSTPLPTPKAAKPTTIDDNQEQVSTPKQTKEAEAKAPIKVEQKSIDYKKVGDELFAAALKKGWKEGGFDTPRVDQKTIDRIAKKHGTSRFDLLSGLNTYVGVREMNVPGTSDKAYWLTRNSPDVGAVEQPETPAPKNKSTLESTLERLEKGISEGRWTGKDLKVQQARVEKIKGKPWDEVREEANASPALRFEAGKKLTKSERQEVMRSIGDVYRDHKLPKEFKGLDSKGDEVYGYPYAPELFLTSSITGKQIRHYITLPDGRMAHPSELFPSITKAKIDKEIYRREQEDEQVKYHVDELLTIASKAASIRDANMIAAERGLNKIYPFTGKYMTAEEFVAATLVLKNKEGHYIRVKKDSDNVELLKNEGFVAVERASDTNQTGPVKEDEKSKMPGEVIQDFGEKIGGARKDYYTAYADKMKEAKDLDVEAEPLSKSWPEPDYEKLIEGGTDPWAVAFVRAARDEVPRKPTQPHKKARWAESVKLLRKFSDDLMSGRISKEKLLKMLDKDEYSTLKKNVGGRADLYVEVGHKKSLAGIRFSKVHWSLYKGEKNVNKWMIEKHGKPAKGMLGFSNMPVYLVDGNTREEALAEFKKKLDSMDSTPQSSSGVKFQIYSMRGKPGFYIGKKIGRDYADLERFDTAQEAREYLKNNRAELEEKLARFKQTPNERRSVNRERIGTDHRNGKDVTPEMFNEAFGFRGVEFGNWVNNAERQDNLNRAYDALYDLALIVNIPTKAISLNGDLGLAFGARGIGGKDAPAAHYEPAKVVINLTKKNGPGSLAHEWLHAMDNFFSRKRGEKSEFISATSRKIKNDPTRIEVLDAFKNLVKTIDATGMKKRSAVLDKKRTKDYWSTGHEIVARAFENYVIEKLAQSGSVNDYLANIASPDSYASDMLEAIQEFGLNAVDMYPYLLDSEVDKVTKAFDDLFRTIQTKETDKGVTMFSIANAWHSQMEKFLDKKLPGSGTPKSLKQTLQSWAKKGEFKEEELMWSGVLDWLDSYDQIHDKRHENKETAARISKMEKEYGGFDPLGLLTNKYDISLPKTQPKVSKQEVLDYLAANNVRVQEVVKGGHIKNENVSDEIEEAVKIINKYDSGFANEVENANQGDVSARIDEAINELYDSMDQIDSNRLDELSRIIYQNAEREIPTKYSQYQVPGGKNYKELLLTLPRKEVTTGDISKRLFGKEMRFLDEDERALVVSELRRMGETEKDYRSSHWDEPNVLAHVRFNERTGPNGEKILFIEEIQSDLHQSGRKKGYIGDESLPEGVTIEKYSIDGTDLYVGVKNGKKITGGMPKRQAVIDEVQGVSSSDRVPNAPFKKTWPIMAFKRMVRYAAENGFDSISWTPGDVQAERYDLSKQVDEIKFYRRPDNSGLVKWNLAIIKDGTEIDRKQFENIEDAESYVGKEIVKKIVEKSEVEKPDGNGLKSGSLSGLDLKVGGEGMKGFYDRILPAEANKFFGKKVWGNAKVVVGEIPTTKVNEEVGLDDWVDNQPGGWNDFESEDEARQAYLKDMGNKGQQQVWELSITPEMKTKAMQEGMSQFNQGGIDQSIARLRESDPENLQKLADNVYKWLQETMPQSVIDRLTIDLAPIITKEGKDTSVSDRDWGKLRKQPGEIMGAATIGKMLGVIELSYNFDDSTIQDSLRHELFHTSVRWLLPDEDLSVIMDHFNGNEEAAANAFTEFSKSPEARAALGLTGEVSRIFHKLRRLLLRLRRALEGKGFTRPEDIYTRILKKEYSLLSEMEREARVEGSVGVNQFSQPTSMSLNKAVKSILDNPNFRKWFGDSKVVDKDGEPLVVYHGTKANVMVFKPTGDTTGAASAKMGIFFTSDPQTAEEYADLSSKTLNLSRHDKDEIKKLHEKAHAQQEIWIRHRKKTPEAIAARSRQLEYISKASDIQKKANGADSIYPVYLTIKDPFIYDFKGGQFRGETYSDLLKKSKLQGNDGAIFQNTIDNEGNRIENIFVVFNPTQIKSIYNQGTFDGSNPDIRFMVAHHGTPHTLQPEPGYPNGRFRLEFIGTGEGGAAYGRGIYFAEKEGTAEGYAKQEQIRKSNYQYDSLAQLFKDNDGDVFSRANSVFLGEPDVNANDSNIKVVYTQNFDGSGVYKYIKQQDGLWVSDNESDPSLYTLDIPDSVIPKLLDWDKNISPENAAKIRKQAKAESIDILKMLTVDKTQYNLNDDEGLGYALGKGQYFYERLAKVMANKEYGTQLNTYSDDKLASEFLTRAGIPGNTHGGVSKGDTGAKYVIWDQAVLDQIALLKRNQKELKAMQEEGQSPTQLRIAKAEDQFKKDQFKNALSVFDTMKKAYGLKVKEGKPDFKAWQRILSIPSHFFSEIPAMGRVFNDGLENVDNRHIILDQITAAPDGHYYTKDLEALRSPSLKIPKEERKFLKQEYKKLQDYLKHRDQNQIGYSIVENIENGTWDIFGIKDKKTPIQTFTREQDAVDEIIRLEAEDYRKTGASDQSIDALIAGRRITHNGFSILFQAMRDLMAYYKKTGQELPTETVEIDGKSVQVNLKLALAKMGDMRGYYMPRIRKPGKFAVMATKKGTNPIRKHFDTETIAKTWAAHKSKQGYSVTVEKQQAMPEDVFQMAGKVVAQGAMINEALQRISTKDFKLSDFGLTAVDRLTAPGNRDFMVTGPANKALGLKELLKNMGGEWFPSEGSAGGPEVWHFKNPGNNFEQRLAKAIAFEKAAIDVDTDTRAMFASALVEQVSNIIKARGVRAHMISRVDAKGKDVWEGYEEDPLLALAKYASGISAGEAKKIMAGKLLSHFSGTDITWSDFKAYVETIQDIEESGVPFEKAIAGFDVDEKERLQAVQSINGTKDADYVSYLSLVESRRVDPVKQPNAWKEGRSYIEYMLKNEESIDRIVGMVRGLAVVKYLGGRVSAPLVNLTAMVTSVPAAMDGIGGVPVEKAFKHLAKAGKLYAQYKFGNKDALDPDVKALFDEIHNKGWHNAQYNREALSVLRGKAGRGWDKLVDWSMLGFGATEQINRVTTIAGAYLGMKAQGQTDHAKMMDTAKKVSDMAHATYGKANYPLLARGSHPAANIMRAFYVFKTFSHNYLLTMKSLWGSGWTPEHAKAFTYMALSPAILAGAGGVVGWDLIMNAIAAVFGLDDPEEDFYKWAEATMGEDAESVARFGLLGLAGINIKGSLEIGVTGLPTSLGDILGAPGSVIKDIYEGGENIIKGNVSKGVERIAPLAIAGPIKAYREATEGLTTRTNAPIFYGQQRVKADMADAILRALSFNPAGIAKVREQKWAERQQETKWTERRSNINHRINKFFLQSIEDRDAAMWADILEDVREYNEKVKREGLGNIIPFITRKSIMANIKRNFKPTRREVYRRSINE